MEVTVLTQIRNALLEWGTLSILAELLMLSGVLLRPEGYFYLLFTLLAYVPMRVYTMKLG